MICFQFQFFLSLIPTSQSFKSLPRQLWFAFNFSSFYLWYQRCLQTEVVQQVVICFQFQFFLSLIPTNVNSYYNDCLLWFAFNFSSFYLWYQPIIELLYQLQSCDLLSISVLSIFDTNTPLYCSKQLQVVICFQFQFFLSLIPTSPLVQTHQSGCDLLSISVLSIFDTNRLRNKYWYI